nr:Em-like protein GEA6 [Tanacetum cinerariifolium]
MLAPFWMHKEAEKQVDSPPWVVRLGRRGSTDSNAAQAVEDLPRAEDHIITKIARGNGTRPLVVGKNQSGGRTKVKSDAELYKIQSSTSGFSIRIDDKHRQRKELVDRARKGETVVPVGTGGKNYEAQQHLAKATDLDSNEVETVVGIFDLIVSAAVVTT